MIWLLLVPLIIFWAYLQKLIVDSTGAAPRSRGSLRSQRRKAAKMGMDVQNVPYNPRIVPMETFKIPRWFEWTCGIIAVAFWAAIIFWRGH